MTYDTEARQSGSGTCVSAMFDSRADAQRAVDRLKGMNITSQQIRMVEGSADASRRVSDPEESKGFWDSLGDLFFPEEDRYSYAEGLSRGGYLVTVNGLAAAQYDTVLDVLDDEGTIDMDEREASWRSEGWGGFESSDYASGVAGTTSDTPYTNPHTGTSEKGQLSGHDHGTVRASEDSIPVVEERLNVGKRDTSHGRVRVRAYTVEEPVSETVELHDDRVEIERRPVDRAVEDGDAAFRDRTLEAEEHREEAVVNKEARIVEEINLRKDSDTHHETVSDTVRHTEVEIDDDRTRRDRTPK